MKIQTTLSNYVQFTAKFGTTPDELAEGRETISRDAKESKVPLKPVISDKSATAASSKTRMSKSATSAQFPPMPTRSPKPLSQSLNQNAPTLTKSSSTSTQQTRIDVDYKKLLTKFYQANAPDRVADVDATLEKYKVRAMCRIIHTVLPWQLLTFCRKQLFPGQGSRDVLYVC